jgi:hypothetical protein
MEIFTLKATLKQLEDDTQALCESLALAPALCANQPGPFETDGRAFSLAKGIYSNVWVADEAEDARETPVVIGAIEVGAQSLLLARNVNATKDNLKRQLMAMRERIAAGLSRAGSDKAFRRHLSDIGLGKLSLRQVYRHVSILNERPKSIAFSFSTKGKSVKRILVCDAIDLLQRSGFEGPHIEIQLRELMSLPQDYMLAQVQHLAAYYKANIRYGDGRRETQPVFMPLLYPQGASEIELPLYLHETQRQIRGRKDQTLEEEAFIPSLRLHRYQCLRT